MPQVRCGMMAEKGWLTSYHHPIIGDMEVYGMLVDFSETPGVIRYPPYCAGQHTREIMLELGYDDEDIEKLCAQGAANDTAAALSG